MSSTVWFEGKALRTKAQVFEACSVLMKRHMEVTDRLRALVNAGKCMPGTMLVYSWTDNYGLMSFSRTYGGYYSSKEAKKTPMRMLGVSLKMAVDEYNTALAFVEEQEAATDETCQRAQVNIQRGVKAGMTEAQALAYALYEIGNYRAEKGNGVTPEQYLEWEAEQNAELLSYAPCETMKQRSAKEAGAYASEQCRRERAGLPVQTPQEWQQAKAQEAANNTELPISPKGLKNKVHSIMRAAGVKYIKQGADTRTDGYRILTEVFHDGNEDWYYIEPCSTFKADLPKMEEHIEDVLRTAGFWDTYVVGWEDSLYGTRLLQFSIFPESTREHIARLSVVANPSAGPTNGSGNVSTNGGVNVSTNGIEQS